MAMQAEQFVKNSLKLIKNGRQMSSGLISGSSENVHKLANKTNTNQLHLTAQRSYPQAAVLPLPNNIDPTESTRFSPQRARDISGNAILTHQSQSYDQKIDITLRNDDPHVESYDCNGAVSLNSTMQSNVPTPFSHSFSHLNMPGGQWEQSSKYMAHDLQSSHYTNLRQETRLDWSSYEDSAHKKGTFGILFNKNSLLSAAFLPNNTIVRTFSLISQVRQKDSDKLVDSVVVDNKGNEKISRKDMLKKAVKEYGSTVIIFHVGISLMSLGACYVMVSSGLDVVAILDYFGWGDTALSKKIATGASTFVIAYAIHKVFAPVRISITLGSTPFIVRILRKKGILKPPKPSM